MNIQFFDRHPLFSQLESCGLDALAKHLQKLCCQRFQKQRHGLLENWRNAWQELPEVSAEFDLQSDSVTVRSATDLAKDTSAYQAVQRTLRKFHPWRKGPWNLLGVDIESEWRSNLKWDRLCDRVEFRNRRILDIGCGNGYYGWRMLGKGARLVLGCEPFLLSVAQFEIFRKYWAEDERHFVVPLSDADLPKNLQIFDLTFSMGVLYHHPSPILHLQTLWGTLRNKGNLVLETLVLEGDGYEVMMPEDRYAKMRNVWFIPTTAMIERWLRRTGFENIQLLSVAKTTFDEQRKTEWMTFESLPDFLLPGDPSRTVEGYPAPVRAMFLAEKRS